ncbi:MAG TPA: hypothetical protein VF377_08775 [Acidimicrobiia bacterium]
MANKSRRVGTEAENWVVALLQEVYPDADVTRRGGNQASWDITGTPVPHEVKRHKTLQIPAWTRQLAARHGDAWVLWCVPRDARKSTTTGHPPVAVLPVPYLIHLLRTEVAYLRSALSGRRSDA